VTLKSLFTRTFFFFLTLLNLFNGADSFFNEPRSLVTGMICLFASAFSFVLFLNDFLNDF